MIVSTKIDLEAQTLYELIRKGKGQMTCVLPQSGVEYQDLNEEQDKGQSASN